MHGSNYALLFSSVLYAEMSGLCLNYKMPDQGVTAEVGYWHSYRSDGEASSPPVQPTSYSTTGGSLEAETYAILHA